MTLTSVQCKEIKQLSKNIANKRARIVIEHIFKHGFITTEELETKYGYNHPPRAARDVREAGIPLETFRVKDTEGRTIAAENVSGWTARLRDQLIGVVEASSLSEAESFIRQAVVLANQIRNGWTSTETRISNRSQAKAEP